MVDALASGASVLMDVEVRVLFWAPLHLKISYLYSDYGRPLRSFVPNKPKLSYQIGERSKGCRFLLHFQSKGHSIVKGLIIDAAF